MKFLFNPSPLTGWLKSLKTRRAASPRRWDWIQVEVSSCCNADCAYCPTALYRRDGSGRMLPMEVFQRLAPSFGQADMVYLQGWGEPFLHPKFLEMARLAKSAGCRVGATTNGTLLTPERLEELVAGGMDILAFSLTGCAETNDHFRKGTCLEKVLETIRELNRVKERLGSRSPEIHIAYQLLRSGLEEVVHLPEMLEGLGIAQVVVSTLEFVPAPELENESLNCRTWEEFRSLQARLDALVESGRAHGVEIHYKIVGPAEEEGGEDAAAGGNGADWAVLLQPGRAACSENIARSVFVNAAGEVTACVFNSLPARTPEEVEARTGRPYQPLVFGSLREQTLEQIWDSPAYRAFRADHKAGRLEGNCRGCSKTRVR